MKRRCPAAFEAPIDNERHDDQNHYAVLAESCHELILAFGSSEEQAWQATCRMAMKLTSGRSEDPNL